MESISKNRKSQNRTEKESEISGSKASVALLKPLLEFDILLRAPERNESVVLFRKNAILFHTSIRSVLKRILCNGMSAQSQVDL